MNRLERFQYEIYQQKEWHARELSIYKNIPHRYVNNLFHNIKETYWKMCVPMIYSHWEGYIVYLIRQLCEFINEQQIGYYDIKERIAVFALEPQMKYLSGNAGLDNRKRFYTEFIRLYNNPVHIDCSLSVSAKSNLNYKQLSDMLSCLDFIIPEKIKNEKNTIEKLVTFRNKIAHGENSITVYEEDVIKFIKTIIEIFDELIICSYKYLNEENYRK